MSRQHHSQLFLLRLWDEETPDGATEWCGKVQHILKADAGTFRGFMALADLLSEMATNHEAQEESANSASEA